MVLEVAILDVKLGMESQFEVDFKKASRYISAIKGYQSHTLHRCLENENRYILHVYWDTLENHTIDFRESAEYSKWKELLHHYYDPFPVVEHYERVI